MRIVWSEPALRDLTSARVYIAADRPDAAIRQVELIVAAVAGLLHFPDTGHPGRRPDTRELVVSQTPYLVPYRIRGDVIEILRVLMAGSDGRTPCRSVRFRSVLTASPPRLSWE